MTTIRRVASAIPKVVSLATCEFPVVEGSVGGYKVLELPKELRRLFDEEGASVVRINSIDVAKTIPDFGGRASGEDHSLLPHQDHLDPHGDPRRFLMLSKLTDGARGSRTFIMTPEVAERALPILETWVTDDGRRWRIGAERRYDRRFLVSEKQYDRCFEKGGYEELIAEAIGGGSSRARELSIRLGILGYVIRGPSANDAMQELAATLSGSFVEEAWESGGSVIIDNPNVFHARLGGNNPPLQRNFCI